MFAHHKHTRNAAVENVNTIDESRLKSLEREFSIVICRPTGDKWQSKILFLSIFDLRSSIFESVFDCCLSVVIKQF